MPDVEFPPLVQQWSFDVLLKDECFGGAIEVFSSPFDNGLYFFKSQTDNDSVASIGEFPWFYYPNVVSVLFGFFLLFVEISQKPRVFGVIEALGDVEGEGKIVKYVLLDTFIVLSHRVEKCLFVPNYEVLTHVVLHSENLGVYLTQIEIQLLKIGISFTHILA